MKSEENIVVTGSYEPVPLVESDRKVEVLDLKGEHNLYAIWADSLRLDSSIDLRERAPGIQTDLSIRGSSFQQSLVLVDGLRVNDAQSGHHNLDLTIPFTSMDRIEVLQGTGSALYGSDAVGGAVNFRTARPEASEIRLGVGGGNFGSNQQYGAAAYASGRLSQQFTLDRDFSSGFIPDRDYRSIAAASETHLSSGLGTTTLLLGVSDRAFGADQFYGNFDSWERTKGWFLGASQTIGDTHLSFGYRRHTDVFDLFRNQPEIYENNHVTESYQLAARQTASLTPRATLFYGGEFCRDSIDSSNLGSRDRNRGSLYVDLKLSQLKRLTLAVGVLGELYSGDQYQLSPTLAAGYRLSDTLKLKASLDHGFRLPTFTDLYYHDPANAGNPNLRPERAWGIDGGVVWNPASPISTELTVFSRWERDGIDYVRPDAQSVWQATNIDRVQFTGVELTSILRLRPSQRLSLGYTGIYSSGTQSGSLLSKYFRNYPRHQLSVGWLGSLPGRLGLRTRVGMTERYSGSTYPLAELSLRKSTRFVSPFLRLTNVLNTGYEEVEGVRMPGRAVMAGLELHWSQARP